MRHTRVFDPAGLVFGILVPVLAAAVGPVLTRAWSSRLPDRIATHWGVDGTADGFADPMTTAWTFAIVTLLIGGGVCAIAALAQALLLMRRIMLFVGSAVVGVLVTLQVSVLWMQLDGASVQQFPGGVITVGMVLGLILGAIGAGLLRDYRERTPATQRPGPRLPRGRRDAVRDVVGFSRTESAVLAAVLLGLAAVGCVFVGSMWPLAMALPLLAIVVALVRFDVLVDENGVHVRNLGLLSIDIGIDEVTGAAVTEVNPFRQWGGWGLRSKGHRRYGIVTRTGPAVEVSTASGLSLTITSEHAEQFAGTLNSWADTRCAS